MAPSGARHSWYGWEAEVSSSSWWSRGMEWQGICFARQLWVFRNRGWLCEIVNWRSLNMDFKWLLVSLLAVRSLHKWPLIFRKGFARLVADAKFFALTFGVAKIASGWYENFRTESYRCENFSHWELVMRNWCKIFSHWELVMRNWCEIFCIENYWYENFRTKNSRCENFSHWLFVLRSTLFSSVLDFPCIWSSKIKLSHNKIKLKLEILI